MQKLATQVGKLLNAGLFILGTAKQHDDNCRNIWSGTLSKASTNMTTVSVKCYKEETLENSKTGVKQDNL